MNMQEIRNLARKAGIKPGKLKKVELVRSFQSQEGNFDCFATANEGICSQEDCLWREDCFSMAKKTV